MRKRRRSRIVLVFVVVLAAGGVAAGARLVGDERSRASVGAAAADATLDALGLPEPVAPAFRPAQPQLLDSSASVSTWAPVRRAAVARAHPDERSPAVAAVPTETPEGTDNIVLVVGRDRDAAGRLWVQVRVPALPDNATGWVDRSTLGGYSIVDTRLEVDLQRLTVTLYRAGRRVFDAPAGVGKPSWPTPKGHFYIRNKLTDFASPAYGPLAFGTSARSSVLTDWPGGGYIGIHGTDEPQLLPGRVSHGCIRLRNSDVLRLGRLMPVGTPVTIT